MRPYRHIVNRSLITDISLKPMLVLYGSKIGDGLTIGDMLAPDAFGVKETGIMVDTTLRLIGSDGSCWATVSGVTPHGTLVITPDITHAPALKKPARA